MFNISFYGLPTLAMGDVGAQREDDEVSLSDTKAGD